MCLIFLYKRVFNLDDFSKGNLWSILIFFGGGPPKGRQDDLKNEDSLKNEEDIKNEDDLKNEDNLKNEDDLKKKTASKMKTT